MIFTKEDFKKIEQYLKKNSYKDSDFSTIETVTGNDKIPIVHYEGEGNTAENVLMAISTIAEYALQNAIPLLKDEIIAFISEYISTPSYGAPLTHIHHFSHDTDEPEGTLHGATFTATSDNVAFNFDCLMKDSDSDEISRTTHTENLPKASVSQAGIINSNTFNKITNTASQLNQHVSAARLALTNENRNGLNDAMSIITGNTPIAPGIYAVDNSGTIHDATDANTYTGTLYYYKKNDNGAISHWLTFITRNVYVYNEGFIGTTSEKVTRIYSTHKEPSGFRTTYFTPWQLISIPMISIEDVNRDLTEVENLISTFGMLHVCDDDDRIIGTLLWTEGPNDTQQQTFQTNYKYNTDNNTFEFDSEDVAFRVYSRYTDDGRRWTIWEISGQVPEDTYLTIADYQTDSSKFLTAVDVSRLYIPATINSAKTTLTLYIPHYSYVKERKDSAGGVELYGVLSDGTTFSIKKQNGLWVLQTSNGTPIQVTNWNWSSSYNLVITVASPVDLDSEAYYKVGKLELWQLSYGDIDDVVFDKSQYDVYSNDKVVGKLLYFEYKADDSGQLEDKKALTFYTDMDLDESDGQRFVAPDDTHDIKSKVYHTYCDLTDTNWDSWSYESPYNYVDEALEAYMETSDVLPDIMVPARLIGNIVEFSIPNYDYIKEQHNATGPISVSGALADGTFVNTISVAPNVWLLVVDNGWTTPIYNWNWASTKLQVTVDNDIKYYIKSSGQNISLFNTVNKGSITETVGTGIIVTLLFDKNGYPLNVTKNELSEMLQNEAQDNITITVSNNTNTVNVFYDSVQQDIFINSGSYNYRITNVATIATRPYYRMIQLTGTFS